MDTPDDIARENWYSEIYDEISSEAISEFTLERLRSYYVQNPHLARKVYSLYSEALAVADHSSTAALMLFTSVIEVGLKTTLLKPVIYGLVHNDAVADLVSDLVVRNNGIDRFHKILSLIMREYSDIDVETFRITGHTKTIWDEISTVQKARNAVAHQAETATQEVATLAEDVASVIINDFLKGVLLDLGLKFRQDSDIAA